MIDGDELRLFGDGLREAARSRTGGALDAALDRLGWRDALSVDPQAATSLLFEAQGAANATSGALDQVLAAALGYPAPAVVLPPLGGYGAPGTLGEQSRSRVLAEASTPRASLGGDGLRVCGIGTATLPRGATALVVACHGGSHVAVQVATAALRPQPIGGMDPDLGLVEVASEVGGAAPLGPVDWPAAVTLGPVDWPAAVALGQLALGHELVGAARSMLRLARDHALVRVQFGRPIAAFQAVRHRLAETLVAIEAAAALLDAAWAQRAPQPAAMAKASAGRAARVAARHCQQVLAGIGFTGEHPFHRHLRRALVLDQLLGSTRGLTRELGEAVLAQGRPPALPPL